MMRAHTILVLSAVVAFHTPLSGQSPSAPLTIISSDGRRTLDTLDVRGRQLVPLDALAVLFRLDVREDGGGTLTIGSGDQSVIVTANQQLVSVAGRLVSLTSPPRRVDGRWLVPVDFIDRALASIASERLEVRARSGLVLIGDVSVPRVSARYRPRTRAGRLSLEITPGTNHTVLEQPGRLQIRFDADAVDVVRLARARGDVVRDIRIDADLPGLSLELGPTYDSYSVSSLPAPDGAAQLVIDLRAAAPATTDAVPAVPPESEPRRARSQPLPVPDAARVPDFAEAPAIRTIVVDAGHGGSDEGAIGPAGTREKDVTLSVATRLRSALEGRLGARVILTRSRDGVVELDERAAIANNNKADLFVSLHANSSVSALPAGAEVFYLSIDEYGPEARELAEREGQLLPVVGGGTREIDMILWEMAQARHLEQSARFAELVEDELRQRVPMSPRAIQQAPFRVLVGANMPAVLIEMGFISNPDQEQQLAGVTFQNDVVDAVVASVLRFRDFLERSRRALASGPDAVGGGDRRAIDPSQLPPAR